MSESILIELYPYDPVSETIKTVGFGKGLSRTKVTGSNVPYHLRMDSTFSHDVSVYENDIPSGSKMSIGTVVVKNSDGKFNYLFGYEWGARQIKVYRGWNAKQFSDYELIFDGSTMAINADRNTITFTITEKASLIPEVLQTNTYTGAGGAGGYADLKGVPKPLCFGYCKNIRPILIDPVKQIWQVHDGTITDIEGVYDGGVPLTKGASVADLTALINDANKPNDGSFRYTLSGYFRLGAPPAKFINADVQGQFYSEVNLPDTIREILLDRTSLTTGDLDTASFDALALKYPGRCSGLYYGALDMGFVEWMENVISSLDSFWYFNALGKLVVRPFAFSTPVATIRNEKINNLRRESSSRPLKEVEILYDRNSEVIPLNEFTLVVQDLNLYVSNKVIRVATDGSGNGGVYSYTGKIEAVMNGENVSDIQAVAFYCAATWLSISPDGSFTISDPGLPTAVADVTANYGEFTAGIRIEIWKSMGVTPTKQLTFASTDYIFDYDQNGYPVVPTENAVITATRTNVSSPLTWTAVDNVGNPVTLTGSGDSRTLTASSITNGPLSAHVDVRAVAPDGTFQETRVILSRGNTGYFNPLADLLSLADSKVDVFYQDNAPTTGMNEGDLWFDTNDGNKLYRRISGTWTFINDARIAQAITDAATAQGTADGKITLYNSTSTPTATAVGDLWYNPTTKSISTWTGSIWVLSADITGEHTAAAIVGQGYMALQNYADWATRVTGTGKPANNAGTTLTLYPYDPAKYTIQGNAVTRIAASAWDTLVYSREGLTGNFRVSATLPADGTAMMFGVTDNPGTGGDYYNLDFALYNNYGTNTYGIYESGTGRGAFGAVNGSQVVSITYDGTHIRYYLGSTVIREIAASPNLTYYAAVALNSVNSHLPDLTFTPLNDLSKTVNTVGPLTTFGSYSETIGNTVRKRGGTHGGYEGGVYGTRQENTCFISARPIQANTWVTILGFTLGSGSILPPGSTGNWQVQYTGSDTGSGTMQLVKNGSTVSGASWSVANFTTATRLALVWNGRRVFIMLDGLVYGGNTSAYDQPAVSGGFYPTVYDYYSTGNYTPPISDGIVDIRYGNWTDVRVFLDDGLTVLNQAGFRTIEGTANAITGQGPGATAPGNEVLNYQDSTGGITIIRNPAGGQYSNASSAIAGQIRIDLPVGFTNTMMQFAVDIYDYSSQSTHTYIISGYNYSGSPAWFNCSAQYIGPESRSRPVRFGYVGAVCTVWIGETTDVWQYPKVSVRDVMLGYSNFSASSWKANWGILISASGHVNVTAAVMKPRAGDAVFGESIFESASGAAASLSNFKTGLGTAAAIIGQGALAIKNAIDLSLSETIPRGSIPPMVAGGGIPYTSTTSSISFSWTSFNIYRPDGSTLTVNSGSQGYTSLPTGFTFRFYPFVTESTGNIGWATGFTNSYGTPAIGYTAPSIDANSYMYVQTRCPLGPFQAATTSSGSGGGSGGGSNCLHANTPMGMLSAGDLRVGDEVFTPTGTAKILDVRHYLCSEWYEIFSEGQLVLKCTKGHIVYHAADGSPVAAEDLKLGDILKSQGNHLRVTSLSLCNQPEYAVGITLDDPHLHYAGLSNILCHNGNPKP